MKIMINCPDTVNFYDLTRSLQRILLSQNERREERGNENLVSFDNSPDRKHLEAGGINIVIRRDDVDDSEIVKDMNKLENLTKRFKPKPKNSGII